MFLLIFSKSMLGIVLILANHGPLRVTRWHFASEIWYNSRRSRMDAPATGRTEANDRSLISEAHAFTEFAATIKCAQAHLRTIMSIPKNWKSMDVMTSAKAKRGVSMGRDAPLNLNASSLLDSPDGRKIHFAIMAIEAGARKLGIDGRQMHDRLKAQDLIHKRLLGRYETLHTQSRQYVADDIVETLQNWEADK